MGIIYEPTGRAKEYAALAINMYKGCTHGCRYCFGAKLPWIPADKYYAMANPKKDILKGLSKDIAKLNGDCPEILLSFLGDVYQPIEMDLGLTRQVLKALIDAGLAFTILTKGGTRAVRDFDLLEVYPRARFGTTLVFTSQDDADHWEPQAPTILNLLKAIREAKKRGIPTWVSLESVIDSDQALELIRNFHGIVDHWKVGKVNYHKVDVDWRAFREEVTELLDSVGANYYIKKSLTDL